MLSSTSIRLSSSSTRLPAGLVRLLRVAGDAAPLEDRLDVAVVLDVLDALLETQAGLVLDVPLLAGLIVLLAWSAAASASSGRRPRNPAWRRRCPRTASASGCGRGSRRSRCGFRRAAAGARSGPCSAPCRACRASGTSRPRRRGSWPGSWCRDCRRDRAAVDRPSSRLNLRTGNSPRMRRRSSAWFAPAAEPWPACRGSVVGSMRQDADGVDVAVVVQAGVGALHVPVAVTVPA